MKRLISFIIALGLTLASFNAVIYAADTGEDSQNRYIDLFTDIGIFKNSCNEEDNVTRAQYAQMLTYLMNKDNMLPSMNGVSYSDVSEDYILSKEINLMNVLGIMGAKDGDRFCPEEKLTADEAVCGLVRALGYTIIAENSSGYPSGYNSVANSLDMRKGIPGNQMTPYMTAGAVARMFYNVLDTKMIDYETDKTLFKTLKLKRAVGRVSAVHGLSMTGGDDVNNGEIVIGGEKYKTSVVNTMEYFGREVEFYYRDDDISDLTVLHIRALKDCKQLTLYSEDIVGLDSDAITYINAEKGRDERAKIASGAAVIYNGRAIANMSADYIPKNGNIRLISTDGSSSYDIIIIFDYQSFVVESIFQGRISFRYGNKYIDADNKEHSSIDLSGDNVIIEKDGKNIEVEAIAKNNTVSIAQSGELCYVTVSDETVKGVIRSVTYDPTECYINGRNYRVNDKFEKLAKSGTDGLREITGGLNAVFYIDAANRIAGMEEAASEMRYGYLKSVDTIKNVAVIYDNVEREFVKYTIDERCLLNGSKPSSLETLTEDIQEFIKTCKAATKYDEDKNITAFEPPIIKFKTDTDRNLTSISTQRYKLAGKKSEAQEGEISRSAEISDNYLTISPYSSKIWQTTDRIFTSFQSDVGIIRAQGCKIMKIPANGNESEFEVSDAAQNLLPDTDNKGVNVILYDIDFETGLPGYIVYVDASGGMNVEIKSELYGVVSVGTGINDEGSECASVTLFSASGGANETYMTNDDDEIINVCKNLKKGDIVQIKKNYKGSISGIIKVMSYNRPDDFDVSIYKDRNKEQGKRMRNSYQMFFGTYLNSKYVTRGKLGTMIKLSAYDQYTDMPAVLQFNGYGILYDGSGFYRADMESAARGDMIFGVEYCGKTSSYAIFKYDTPQYTADDEFLGYNIS